MYAYPDNCKAHTHTPFNRYYILYHYDEIVCQMFVAAQQT